MSLTWGWGGSSRSDNVLNIGLDRFNHESTMGPISKPWTGNFSDLMTCPVLKILVSECSRRLFPRGEWVKTVLPHGTGRRLWKKHLSFCWHLAYGSMRIVCLMDSRSFNGGEDMPTRKKNPLHLAVGFFFRQRGRIDHHGIASTRHDLVFSTSFSFRH